MVERRRVQISLFSAKTGSSTCGSGDIAVLTGVSVGNGEGVMGNEEGRREHGRAARVGQRMCGLRTC